MGNKSNLSRKPTYIEREHMMESGRRALGVPTLLTGLPTFFSSNAVISSISKVLLDLAIEVLTDKKQ
jgi:hypothetical protein